MADAKVTINGDSRDAVRSLRAVGNAADVAGRKFSDIAKEATLTGLAVVGMDTAVAAIQRTIQLAIAPLAEYVEHNAQARIEMQGLAAATTEFKVALGESILGGENANIIFGNFRDVMLELTGAMAANGTESQNLARAWASGLLKVASFGVLVIQQLILYYKEFRVELVDLSGAWNELAVETAGAWDVVTTALSGGDWRAAMAEANAAGTAAREEHRRQVNELLDDMDETREMYGEIAQALLNNAADIENGIAANSEALSEITVNVNSGGGGDASTESGVAGIWTLAANAAREYLSVNNEAVAKVIAMREHEAMLLDASQQGKIEAMRAYQEQLTAIEEEAAERRAMIAQQEADHAADLLARRQGMAQKYASSVGGLIAELASGQRKALDVIKEFVGQELIAKGTSNLLEAAAMFFKPGMQVMAAGLTAASVAMITAGARMSKKGGGAKSTGGAAASGAAPLPQSSGAINRTEVNTQVNFGVVGDPREAARVVADLNRKAARDGYSLAGAA